MMRTIGYALSIAYLGDSPRGPACDRGEKERGPARLCSSGLELQTAQRSVLEQQSLLLANFREEHAYDATRLHP